eukprot:15469048-Alexandrium_andersonii.AAC.1
MLDTRFRPAFEPLWNRFGTAFEPPRTAANCPSPATRPLHNAACGCEPLQNAANHCRTLRTAANSLQGRCPYIDA